MTLPEQLSPPSCVNPFAIPHLTEELMRITRNIGFLLLGIFLILYGLSGLGLGLGIIVALVALVAGIFILIEK